jgi:midasin (ATPase involved in ribosome maturation)
MDEPVDEDVFFNFIYLFQAPKEDSNLVNIFEMSDLYYRSTQYLPQFKNNNEEELKNNNEEEFKKNKEEEEDYLNSRLTLNEEQFYTKLNDIIKTSIDVNENKLYLLFTLLKQNYLIKTSS